MAVESVCIKKDLPTKSTKSKGEEATPPLSVHSSPSTSSVPATSLTHGQRLSFLPRSSLSPHPPIPSPSSQSSLLSTLSLFDETRCVHFTAERSLSVEYPLSHVKRCSHNLTFKGCKGFPRILRHTLFAHGFSEVETAARSSIRWSLSPVHAEEVRYLESHQKINHFLRIQGITRKDRLCENVQRMQEIKGLKHFDIIPKTFVLPGEWSQFESAYHRLGGIWIIKPVCLSRGRGIQLVSHPSQVSLEEPLVVSRYIDDPLCINGMKFDLRLYVLVTSYDPLRVYLYEEGLGRFATIPYLKGCGNISNLSMHLTNYSFNKDSPNFIVSNDPERDDHGSKWSSSAVFRYLRKQGHDVDRLLMAIEDVIIKTVIAGEVSVSSAQRCQPFHGNCFELLGFDILIDRNLRPWVLEVNLSPSLKCDTPIDLKIKSKLIADMFSLVGISAPNSTQNITKTLKRNERENLKKKPSPSSVLAPSKLRVGSKFEENTVLLLTKAEYRRRGGFVRIFPSHNTWELYSGFLENKTKLNYTLHRNLYPENGKIRWPPSSVGTTVDISKKLLVSSSPRKETTTRRNNFSGLCPSQRIEAYVRKLSLGVPLPSVGDSDFCDEYQIELPPSSSSHLQKLIPAYLKKLLAYLSQITSGNTHSSQEIDKLLDMLIQFLRSSFRTLSSDTDVILPEKFLSQNIRYRMIVQQLKDFVIAYEKEMDCKDEARDQEMEETLQTSDISDLEEMILNNCSSHPLFECITELVKSVRFQFPVKMEEHPDFSKLRSAASQCDRKVPRRSRTRDSLDCIRSRTNRLSVTRSQSFSSVSSFALSSCPKGNRRGFEEEDDLEELKPLGFTYKSLPSKLQPGLKFDTELMEETPDDDISAALERLSTRHCSKMAKPSSSTFNPFSSTLHSMTTMI